VLKFKSGASPQLRGFVDSDFTQNKDRKSTTGFVFFINQGPISWSSHHQSLITTFTAETEYVALFAAGKEAV
jgi:hypothetical protein